MTFHYLALGDSYTIGEQVPLHDSFPYQMVQLLRKHFVGKHKFLAPEIVAKTGWTTDEKNHHISNISLLEKYEIVNTEADLLKIIKKNSHNCYNKRLNLPEVFQIMFLSSAFPIGGKRLLLLKETFKKLPWK